MTDVKRNEHMLPIANWLRDQINETLSRYDIPSDVYDTDTLIDALCVCAVDRSQAALRARLETVEKRGKVLEQGWKIADDGRIEAETRANLTTHANMRCAECDCEKGGADCNWIATPTLLNDPRVEALMDLIKRAEHNVPKYYTLWHADARAALEAIASPSISALEENK